MYTHSRCSQVILAVVVLYPPTVLACIVITANHFLLGAVCGGAVLGTAHYSASWVPQLGRGTNPGRRPCLGGGAGGGGGDCEAPLLRPYGGAAAACEKRLARGGDSAAASELATGAERARLIHISVQA